MKRKDINKAIAMLAVLLMAFCMTACGSSNQAEDPEPTETTEVSTEPAADAYDIMAGLKTDKYDGNIDIYGNDWLLIMPDNGAWDYKQIDESAFSIYMPAAVTDELDGQLVTIRAYDPDDTSYMDMPDYTVCGVGNNCGKTFVAIYPTDVTIDLNDSELRTSYEELRTYLNTIDENSETSPFRLSDGQ